MVQTKIIKILSITPIAAKGGVYGPILTPYTEKTNIIFSMITQGLKVVEVLKDGTELKLTAINFDKENNKEEIILYQEPVNTIPEPIPVEIPKQEPIVVDSVVEEFTTMSVKKKIIPDVIEKK